MPDLIADEAAEVGSFEAVLILQLRRQGGVPISLIASRQLNVPALHAKAKNGAPAVLPLDIIRDELPTSARDWVERLGIPAEQQESFLGAVHGIWKAWLQNDLVRLIATVRPVEPTAM